MTRPAGATAHLRATGGLPTGVVEQKKLPAWVPLVPMYPDARRITTPRLTQQLRKEAWTYAIDQLDANSNDFVTAPSTDTKPLKLHPPATNAVLHANTG